MGVHCELIHKPNSDVTKCILGARMSPLRSNIFVMKEAVQVKLICTIREMYGCQFLLFWFWKEEIVQVSDDRRNFCKIYDIRDNCFSLSIEVVYCCKIVRQNSGLLVPVIKKISSFLKVMALTFFNRSLLLLQ